MYTKTSIIAFALFFSNYVECQKLKPGVRESSLIDSPCHILNESAFCDQHSKPYVPVANYHSKIDSSKIIGIFEKGNVRMIHAIQSSSLRYNQIALFYNPSKVTWTLCSPEQRILISKSHLSNKLLALKLLISNVYAIDEETYCLLLNSKNDVDGIESCIELLHCVGVNKIILVAKKWKRYFY